MTDTPPSQELLPCPFCGGEPTIQPWHGGKRTKKMISCPGTRANSIMGYGMDVTCPVAPMVTGETKREAIQNWNTRTPPQSVGDAELDEVYAVANAIADVYADKTNKQLYHDLRVPMAKAAIKAHRARNKRADTPTSCD